MKKKVFIVSILCLALLLMTGICWPSNSSEVKTMTIRGPVLIDRLQNSLFNLELIYSTATLDEIEVFDADPVSLTADSSDYTSYTEGFVSTEKNNFLLNAINVYRNLNGEAPISYYHNYIETEDFDFVSLSNGLNHLYIISHETGEVTTPQGEVSYAYDKQYIYHITEGTDAFYILSGKANSYEAFWYSLDKEDFTITNSKRFVPPITATKRNQYALDSEGTAYFTGNTSLYVVSAADAYSIPLSFTPDEIYYNNHQIYTFSVSELFLNVAVFDEKLENIITSRVNLPNKEVQVIDSFLDQHVLYTISYDAAHPLYRNYLTLYDLNKSEMIYCLALKDNSDLNLLRFQLKN